MFKCIISYILRVPNKEIYNIICYTTYLLNDCLTASHFQTEFFDHCFLVVTILIDDITVDTHVLMFIFNTLLYVFQYLSRVIKTIHFYRDTGSYITGLVETTWWRINYFYAIHTTSSHCKGWYYRLWVAALSVSIHYIISHVHII